jgi:ATP-dependent Zn protease
MFSSMKAIGSWLFILLCLVMLWGIIQRSASAGKEMEYAYSDLFAKVQNGLVQDAIIRGDELKGHLKTSPLNEFHTALPANHDDLLKAMLAAKVNFVIKPEQSSLLRPLLITFGPITLLLLLFLPPFREIFKKAGFQPVLSILMLVPLVNLLLLYVVAYSEWKSGPAQKS